MQCASPIRCENYMSTGKRDELGSKDRRATKSVTTEMRINRIPTSEYKGNRNRLALAIPSSLADNGHRSSRNFTIRPAAKPIIILATWSRSDRFFFP